MIHFHGIPARLSAHQIQESLDGQRIALNRSERHPIGDIAGWRNSGRLIEQSADLTDERAARRPALRGGAPDQPVDDVTRMDLAKAGEAEPLPEEAPKISTQIILLRSNFGYQPVRADLREHFGRSRCGRPR